MQSLLLLYPFQHLENGVSHTGGAGLTQTEGVGVTHTAKGVQEESILR